MEILIRLKVPDSTDATTCKLLAEDSAHALEEDLLRVGIATAELDVEISQGD